MVRDEADIIEASLRHMASQGVAQLLVVDNGSSDGTLDALRALQNELPGLHVGLDHEPAYFQSAKMTLLADAVRSAGARWIVPFDADEFWYGQTSTVAESLVSTSGAVLRAGIYNAFPSARSSGLWVDPQVHPDTKVAFRSFPGTVITMGNHEVHRPGNPRTDLRVLHVPWRSLDQFRRKVTQGRQAVDAADVPEDLAVHWRHLGRCAPLTVSQLWSDLMQGSAPPEMVWRPTGQLRFLGQAVPDRWSLVREVVDGGPGRRLT